MRERGEREQESESESERASERASEREREREREREEGEGLSLVIFVKGCNGSLVAHPNVHGVRLAAYHA